MSARKAGCSVYFREAGERLEFRAACAMCGYTGRWGEQRLAEHKADRHVCQVAPKRKAAVKA